MSTVDTQYKTLFAHGWSNMSDVPEIQIQESILNNTTLDTYYEIIIIRGAINFVDFVGQLKSKFKDQQI